MNETWKKWEPVKGLAKKYYIDAIQDDIGGFKVKLTDRDNEDNKLTIIFLESVWSYRSVEEGLRALTMEKLAQKYGANFYTEWTFFKIENSRYLNWIYEESYDVARDSGLMHFCLVGMDDILDIIASCDPQVFTDNE